MRTEHRGRDKALFLVAFCAAACVPEARAQSVEDLARLPIEELANIEVTSISRRPEPLSRAPASVYVITAEEIRRSGATSLPEALRLAPNLEVARLNTYNYAITARGFNSIETSNKLLVLVDGRSVYSPLAATVFWEGVDVSLPDVERIEVVSGPGGTLWGANAVNGVINVITRHSRDSQGVLVDGGAGNRERNGTVRYGGRLDEDTTFRVYANRFLRDRSDPREASDILDDKFRGTQGGFRLDREAGENGYTIQGDLYRNRTPFLDTELHGANALGRWTRRLGEGSSLQLQAYYDSKNRDYALAEDEVRTYAAQAQHNLSFAGGHQFVWGGEYRLWQSSFVTQGPFVLSDPDSALWVGNVFAQGEIALDQDLRLTLGSKFENSSYTGLDALPNVRLAWTVAPEHMLWGAVSRAVRTPSRIDRELTAPGILLEADAFRTEKLTAYEIGYRGSPAPRATISISTFYNVYDDLRTTVPSQPVTAGNPLGLPLVLSNDMRGRTFGVESWGSYGIADWWRLRAGMNWIQRDFEVEPGITDYSDPPTSGQDPMFQWRLSSEFDLSRDVFLDVALRRVGAVEPSGVPAYTQLDAHLGWQVTPQAELSLHGTNLLDRHYEVNDLGQSPVRYIGRTVFAKIRAEF
ncbi:TonB-dependent receptor plug domain-containing protein [Arenibaculum pallidiluteum]|uniref:TonB-dependent receptor plug domain-containing protein n=1 Tax=Arenibaculum pallidiluteum TaxID=2812559 RepID=UPI001A960D20|nr:TonB-dependent receptor [Arenibaculum pallidiluteum]